MCSNWLSKSATTVNILAPLTLLLFSVVGCTNAIPTSTQSLSLETTAPQVSIDSDEQSLSKNRSSTIYFSATTSSTSNLDHFECHLGATAAFIPCSSPAQLTDLSDGPQEFWIRAIDTNGNISTPAVSRWIVDSTIPTISITSQPSVISGSSTADFQFLASDNYTQAPQIECALDTSIFSTCTSPLNYLNLSEGLHTIQIRARDEADNFSGLASYSWTVDLSAPAITLTPLFFSPTNSSTVQFLFSAMDNGQVLNTGYQCQIDGGSFTPCSSPYTASGLATGNHSLGVRVLDLAGNTSAIQSAQFTIDLVAPTLQFNPQPNTFYNTQNITIYFTAADDSAAALTLLCQLDQLPTERCSSPTSFVLPTNISEGTHTVTILATDAANNQTQLTSQNFAVDLTPPPGLVAFAAGTTFNVQLSGPINTIYAVDAYVIDLEDHESDGVIANLKTLGRKVICHFSAGHYENRRSDAKDFANSDIGANAGSGGNKWLDIRSTTVQSVIATRIDRARVAGCDAIAPADMDGYKNTTGFNFTPQDEIDYLTWLTITAHSKGLAIGLRNATELIPVGQLHKIMDYTLNEECYSNGDCANLQLFAQENKAVYVVEYADTFLAACPAAKLDIFTLAIFDPNLDGSKLTQCP